MSTDFHAEIGYGFQLTEEKLIEDINEGRIKLPVHLAMMWAGNAFSGDMEIFIVAKGSASGVASWQCYSRMIASEELVAAEDWETQLLIWADENNVAHAATGWWLCTSLS